MNLPDVDYITFIKMGQKTCIFREIC
jgi:hypothetical protein